MNLHRARRAMDHQREAVRSELHATVDRLVDGWPAVEHWAAVAATMHAHGERRGSGVVDPTGAAVEALDANRAHRWLRLFEQLRYDVRTLDALLADVSLASVRAPASAAEGADVEPCARCGLPNPDMKRLDGRPLCKVAMVGHGLQGQACFWIEWRALRTGDQNQGRATAQPS
jgi:hypothetical protein